LFLSTVSSRKDSRSLEKRSLEDPQLDSRLRLTTDWYKALNNLISVALANVLLNGDYSYLMNPLPTPNVRHQPLGSRTILCNRQFNFDDPQRFEGVLQRVYNSGILRIGVSSFVNLSRTEFNATGTPQGFLFDLSNALTNEMGFILDKSIRAEFIEFYTTSFFDNMTAILANDTVDTVIGVTFTMPRSLRTDFTCRYFSDYSSFYAYRDPHASLPRGFRQNPNIGILQWNSPLIRVATLAGSIYEEAVRHYLPNAVRVYFPNMTTAFESVGRTTDIFLAEFEAIAIYAPQEYERIGLTEFYKVSIGGGIGFATAKK